MAKVVNVYNFLLLYASQHISCVYQICCYHGIYIYILSK